ncbi:MAG: pyridoxal 5'-phosphate synthase glutaminase subunit PdxT [Actinobacteria bacterium]|nr:pyridoxal 5'-phosphate synthase glutaminase subunit PdxT [Actinomycetota bacterium]
MSKGPRVGVLAIQGDVREHINHLAALGAQSVLVRSLSDLDDLQGLIIPGGESTTMSILAKKNNLFDRLRELAKQIPMYGSCAGLIMLANKILDGRPDQETIGGLDIVAARNAFGRQVDSFEIDLNMPQLGDEPFKGVFIRAPLVVSAGQSVEILAQIPKETFADDQDRIVAVRQGNLIATSFHPEIVPDLRIHQYFLEMVRSA